MDNSQWVQQEIGMVKPMEDEIAPTTCSSGTVLERKARPQKDQGLNCPRCNSTNTKFCYYNNYSLTQPRYFCKTCRRYWTEGGSLRNVPVGGGSRKNKKLTSSSSSVSTISADSSHGNPVPNPPSFLQFSFQNSNPHGGQYLNLTFPGAQVYNSVPQFLEFPKIMSQNYNQPNSYSSTSSTSASISALELLRSTGMASRGLNSLIAAPTTDTNMLHTSGFAFHEFKPVLGSSIDRLGSRYGGVHGVQENGARLMFPFGEQLSCTADQFDQNQGQGSSNIC